MRRRVQILPFSFLWLAVSVSVSAQTFTARVVGVVDGDNVTVYDGNQQIEIRLEGIDCPEQGAAFSQRAKQLTSDLVFGKEVRIVRKELDQYGRVVARVHVGQTDVSLALIEAGLAWHYKYYSDDPVLAAAETVARAKKVGLWSLPNPVPPWEARHPELRSTPRALLSSGSGQPDPGGEPGSIVYHGNSNSRVYHGPGCQHYNCSNCTILLKSKEEAARQGFRPHVQCAGAAASSIPAATGSDPSYATSQSRPASPPARESGTTYHGNSSSKVYHAPGCQHYNCKNCTVVLKSKEEAAQKGFRPHGGSGSCVR